MAGQGYYTGRITQGGLGGQDLSLVICDTNIFISLFRNIPQTVAELESIGSENVLIPSVSVMELYRGMQNKTELAEMQKKIRRYNILHFNEEVSKQAIELTNKFRLSHNLQIPDAIIGAMSIVYNTQLLTYNKKDFKFIPGIKLYA
jgi:predicted nucleic acid-binding protein